MHLGRFHQAIHLLVKDNQETKHVALITDLISTLNIVAGNPTDVVASTNYKDQLNLCKKKLSDSKLNQIRPILHSIFQSINAQDYIGDKLFNRIISAISENQAAPALAINQLNTLLKEVQMFFVHINDIDEAFTALQVEYDQLEDGESEIGLLIPRSERNSSLKDLSKEFEEWNKVFSPIIQLFDNSFGSLQIKSCSTSDWMLYIGATPPLLLGISLTLKGINVILKDFIDMRLLVDQLVSKNVSEKHIDGIKKDSDKEYDNKIRELAEKIVDENYKGEDDGIKNEMKNNLNISLKTIAKKITNGAKIELKLQPTKIPESNTDETNTELNIDPNAGESIELSKESNLEEINKLNELSLALDNEIDLINFDSNTTSQDILLTVTEEDTSSK